MSRQPEGSITFSGNIIVRVTTSELFELASGLAQMAKDFERQLEKVRVGDENPRVELALTKTTKIVFTHDQGRECK